MFSSKKIKKKTMKCVGKYDIAIPMYVYDKHRYLTDRQRKEEKLKQTLIETGNWKKEENVPPMVDSKEGQSAIQKKMPISELHVLCTPLVPARYGWLVVVDRKTKALVVSEELDILKDTPEGPEVIRAELYMINGLEVCVINGTRTSVCEACGDVHMNIPYYHCADCDSAYCAVCMMGSVKCELCKIMD
jgi:hypothetical protein